MKGGGLFGGAERARDASEALGSALGRTQQDLREVVPGRSSPQSRFGDKPGGSQSHQRKANEGELSKLKIGRETGQEAGGCERFSQLNDKQRKPHLSRECSCTVHAL